MNRVPVLPLALSSCVLLGACAAAPPADAEGERPDIADVAPTDLTIEATVIAGRGVATFDRAERRPARYILFPDGGLHADVGRTIDADVRPGLTRRLERQQMAALWLVARETGLADPDNGEPGGNDSLVTAAPGEIVQVVTFVAHDRRWRFVRAGPADGELDPATSRFVRELAALAWTPDVLPAQLRPAVVRYDFGPDPLAMFRPPPASPAAPAIVAPPRPPVRPSARPIAGEV